jgi:uncharacterized protein (TIGR03790 family)
MPCLYRIVIGVILLVPSAAWALGPDQVALVVNRNMPQGRELAEFYKLARHIPDGRIIELDLPMTEEMSFERYERDVVLPIRAFLREHQLAGQVRCLVTFHGVPIRVAGREDSFALKDESHRVRIEMNRVLMHLQPIVRDMEALARALEPGFAPLPGEDMDTLPRRADHAQRAIIQGANRQPPEQRAQTEIKARQVLALAMGQFPDAQPLATTRQVRDLSDVALEELVERRNDPDARAEIRRRVAQTGHAFAYGQILHAHFNFLQNTDTHASLDSELSLLWWPIYPRARWMPNPLHHQFPREIRTDPVLMVTRLDAHDPQIVRRIILDSLKTERDGLRGNMVIDSRGLAITDKPGEPDGYGRFDQALRDLARLVDAHATLPLTHDTSPEVLPPNSVRDVALYVGWYSLQNYVQSMTFVPGAVGYHVASFEMTSLRNPSRQWVRNLLADGIAATLGPVAEPYLHAFPPPAEFFPLLMTGKLTLAEVYWRTVPITSWQMSVIGDPLYRPFAAAPALAVEHLPDALHGVIRHE